MRQHRGLDNWRRIDGFNATGTDIVDERILHVNIAEIEYITWTAPLLEFKLPLVMR